MIKTPHLLLACLAVGLAPFCRADVHKCIVTGKIVYTDQICPDAQAAPLELPALNGAGATEVTYTGSLWLKDHYGYERAISAAAEEKLPVLIYAYTDWCGYCKTLESSYFKHTAIDKTLRKIIKVKINPEHSNADRLLFKNLGGSGYPALWIKPPDQPAQRIQDPFIQMENGRRANLTADTFNKYLLQALMPYQQPPP